MTSQNIVTLPVFEDVCDFPLALSDYAMATGAMPLYTAAGQTSGETWLRTTSCRMACLETYRRLNNVAEKRMQPVTNPRVGVAPCFEITGQIHNGFGVVEQELTFDNQKVYYPQTRVTTDLAAKLTALRDNNDDAMQVVGCFKQPMYYSKFLQSNVRQDNLCYAYQGQCYVDMQDEKMRDHWFQCEPIRVSEINQALQCKNALFAAPFASEDQYFHEYFWTPKFSEVNVEKSDLGKFLNHEFFNDLQASTKLHKYITKAKLSRFQLMQPTSSIDATL